MLYTRVPLKVCGVGKKERKGGEGRKGQNEIPLNIYLPSKSHGPSLVTCPKLTSAFEKRPNSNNVS